MDIWRYIKNSIIEPEIEDPIEVYESRRLVVPEDERHIWDFFVKNIYKDFPELKSPKTKLDGHIFDKPQTFKFFDIFCSNSNMLKIRKQQRNMKLNKDRFSFSESSRESSNCNYDDNSSRGLHLITKASNRPFVCDHPGCTKTYTSKNGLDYHLAKGHTEQIVNVIKPFKCTYIGCSTSYKTKNGLKYHLKIRHSSSK